VPLLKQFCSIIPSTRQRELTIWRIAAVISFSLIAEPGSAQIDYWAQCSTDQNSGGAIWFEFAIGGCTRLIDAGNQPELYRAFTLRGNAFSARGGYNHDSANCDLAITDYTEAIRLDPNYAYAFAGRGYAYNKKGYYDDAITDYTEAIRLDPNYAYAFAGRGYAYNKKGYYDDAITDYAEAIRLDPSYAYAFAGRGEAYNKKGYYDDAITDYAEAIRLDPSYAYAFAGRGDAYRMKGDNDRAISNFDWALSIDPNYAFAYRGRGHAYYSQTNYGQAIRDYDESIRLDPDRLAFLYRGHAYKALGQSDRALVNYDEAIRLELGPTITVAFPAGHDTGGAKFAFPPLPDEAQLSQCIDQNRNRPNRRKEDFYQCVIDQAFPEQYKIARNCLDNNPRDGGRALLCTTQRQELVQAYDKFRSVQNCASQNGSRDRRVIARCIGQQVLGQQEQYYLDCVTANNSNLKTAPICAVAGVFDLTPEQQIALSCLVETGFVAYAYAVCVGGQLLTRELEKCWTRGIFTEGGCFGPNNEYVKFINNIDEEAQRLMGPNSEAYRAWKLWKDNVLAPGPNGEVVKFLNNGLGDIRDGPGENNEIVKLGNSVGDAVQSLGTVTIDLPNPF
jgi:tetratricopeptide (TPR) repeat protein